MTALTNADLVDKRHSFLEVWIITLGHALTHWYPATFYILVPVIGRDLGLSYTQIATIITVEAIAGALANIPGGMLVDSFGRKGLLMATSMAWIGVPYALMAFTSAYWVMLVCAALIGVGNTLWHPTAIPTLARRFPDRKGFVVSIHGMGGNVGDAVAPFVAGAMLNGLVAGSLVHFVGMTWRQVMILNVIPGMCMAIAIVWYLGRLDVGDTSKAATRDRTLADLSRNIGSLFHNKVLMLLSTSSAFRAMTQSSLLVFIPLYLANVMGYSTWTTGLAMMGLQAAGFIAAPIAGALSDKAGRRNVMISSMVMTALVLLVMVFAGGTPIFVVFVALLGFFLFAIRAVLQAWTLDATPPGMGGTAIGVLFGIQSIGTSVGPLICGALADRFGLLSTFYFMAFTVVIANLFVFFMPKDTQIDAPSARRSC